jgi:hypothetical protein
MCEAFGFMRVILIFMGAGPVVFHKKSYLYLTFRPSSTRIRKNVITFAAMIGTDSVQIP